MRTCGDGCNGCDDCTDYSDMTEEDRNREYLRERPALELSMWQDWVLTVCGWRKITPPTCCWNVVRANQEQANA